MTLAAVLNEACHPDSAREALGVFRTYETPDPEQAMQRAIATAHAIDFKREAEERQHERRRGDALVERPDQARALRVLYTLQVEGPCLEAAKSLGLHWEIAFRTGGPAGFQRAAIQYAQVSLARAEAKPVRF